MSDPRFRPRSMVAPSDCRYFGKVATIGWVDGGSWLERSRIDAARLQHLVAVRIHARLIETGHSIRSYARVAGVGYDRMTKVLRGEALMRLEDISDAERLLGGILSHPPTCSCVSTVEATIPVYGGPRREY